MDDNSKKEHFTNIVKKITEVCHDACFDSVNNKFDTQCSKICFEKYSYTLNKLNKFLIKTGKETKSELLIKAYNLNEDDKSLLLFPPKGYNVLSPFNYPNRLTDTLIYPRIGKNEFKPEYFWR